MRSFAILAVAVLTVSTPAFAAPHSARQVEYNGPYGGIFGELPPVDPDCVHLTLQNAAKCIGPAIGRRAADDDMSGAIKLGDVAKGASILSSVISAVQSFTQRSAPQDEESGAFSFGPVCARGLNEPRCCGVCQPSIFNLFGGARRNYADGSNVARSAEELD